MSACLTNIRRREKTNKFLDLVARYGNLFPYLIAMVVGLLVGELDAPVVTGDWNDLYPDIHAVTKIVIDQQ